PVTVIDAREQEEKRSFPLGGKVEDRVSETRIRAGGEVVRRSKRDIGRELSMRVGKYSFERIRV
ncbi:hypothetical protein LTS18_013564, partial [Coniosporium uncinatum]